MRAEELDLTPEEDALLDRTSLEVGRRRRAERLARERDQQTSSGEL